MFLFLHTVSLNCLSAHREGAAVKLARGSAVLLFGSIYKTILLLGILTSNASTHAMNVQLWENLFSCPSLQVIYKTIDVWMDGWMLPQDPTSYHSTNSQALDATLGTELKVQLHYLLAVWLGANYLTSLNLIFLISKWDTVKHLMVLGEDYIWEGCKSLAQCLECFFPTALVAFLWHVSLV